VVTLHWNLDSGFGRWAFRSPFHPAAVQFLSQAQLNCSQAGLPPDLPSDRVKLLMSGLAIDEFLSRGDGGRKLRAMWGIDSDTVVLGTASVIRPRKRLEDFIQIVLRLRNRGLKVLGVIAGGEPFADSQYLNAMKSLISDLSLQSHCLMVGNIDPITPFFQAIDVSINTADMEILSMSLCEAQSCRKPTLAYAVGGNPEALPDSWFTVPLGDLDALEQKALRLVVDEQFRKEMGTRAWHHVRTHFDAPALAARQAAIYEDILGCKLAIPAPAAAASCTVGSPCEQVTV
jgi:glycosyltransferase involved in cell wall biosynthesis